MSLPDDDPVYTLKKVLEDYDFKGEKLTGEVIDDLNYQFMRHLEKEGLVTLKELYIDGTKIEAIDNCSPLELLQLQFDLLKIAEGDGISFHFSF